MKINVDDQKKLWIVSDTHFNHKKLCTSYPDHFDAPRKYATIEEMNHDIVTRWNATVGKNDQVIMLGDWFMGTPFNELRDRFLAARKALNGNIIAYVAGNHDEKLMKVAPEIAWLDRVEFEYHGRHYICQHRDFIELPVRGVTPTPELVLVHGHTHSFEKTSQCALGTQNNVCWEARYDLANADDLCSVTEELINVDLEDEVLESLASKAKEKGVPLANFVKSLLEKAIKEQKND